MIAGRYTLDREIGRGGMGAVWLGRDEVLDRAVALKRIGLLPGADSIDLERAEREARMAARLNHDHVVAVFNLVADSDPGSDVRWLVMEYVDGTTLAQLVREVGPLSAADAAPLLWQAADALVAAHAAGIVHRDVKPSNILVDRDRRLKLTDFGIARVATDPSLTQTGLVTGSPAYLAPEVAAGGRGDEAVDVWSLGATAFYLLAGRPPYEFGDNVLGGLYRIVNEEPPALPEAGWLAPLLEHTLVKDPSRRWSMRQVRDFLAGPAGRTEPAGPAIPAGTPQAAETAETAETSETEVLAAAGPASASTPEPTQAGTSPGPRRDPKVLGGLVVLALALVLGLVLWAALPDRTTTADVTADNGPESPSQSPSASPSATPSDRPTETSEPTARGMQSFIRGYVAAVATDRGAAWQMLTPKFQRQSGGWDTYRSFWRGVGDGRILDIAADPRNLVVSYRVRFDNFGTGRRPTVLQLVYDGGRYLIDGERTEGFVPAG